MPFSGAGLFSGLNNFDRYSSAFGFTPEEIRQAVLTEEEYDLVMVQ